MELLTAGGRGVPMLAASYAAERGVIVPEMVSTRMGGSQLLRGPAAANWV